MTKLRATMEETRMEYIKKLEEQKEAKIRAITSEHSRKYADIKSYYSDITATNLDLIK